MKTLFETKSDGSHLSNIAFLTLHLRDLSDDTILMLLARVRDVHAGDPERRGLHEGHARVLAHLHGPGRDHSLALFPQNGRIT